MDVRVFICRKRMIRKWLHVVGGWTAARECGVGGGVWSGGGGGERENFCRTEARRDRVTEGEERGRKGFKRGGNGGGEARRAEKKARKEDFVVGKKREER